MSDKEVKIEEFRQMRISDLPDGASALIKFDENHIEIATVSFDEGKTWIRLMAVKMAVDSFVDRYADKFELT
jgi:hypothetical protein